MFELENKMLDKNITYALSLGGGGFKGSYQAGVIVALHEEGIKFSAVVGTSIGSINGMMVASKKFEELKKLWLNFDIKDVFNIHGKDLEKMISLNFSDISIIDLGLDLINTFTEGGLDISPLIDLINKHTDESSLRKNNARFGLVTYNQTDKKLMEIMLEDMPEGTLPDFLLASSYLPVFKKIKLGGKYYLDGGYYNELPTNMLAERGYKDIIEIDLSGLGKKRPKPKNVNIHTVKTDEDIGHIIIYSKTGIDRGFDLGYFDGIRLARGFFGKKYVINAPKNERFYMDLFLSGANLLVENWNIDPKNIGSSERCTLEYLVPEISKKLGLKNPYSYKDVYLSLVEKISEDLKIDRFKVYHIAELEKIILSKTENQNNNKKKNLALTLNHLAKGINFHA